MPDLAYDMHFSKPQLGASSGDLDGSSSSESGMSRISDFGHAQPHTMETDDSSGAASDISVDIQTVVVQHGDVTARRILPSASHSRLEEADFSEEDQRPRMASTRSITNLNLFGSGSD
jgi:hypothetical protein